MQAEIMVYTHDAVFFCDTLTSSTPYISDKPRNHDSFAFVTDGTLGYEKQGKTVQIKKGRIAYIAKGSIDKSSAYGCDAVSYIAVNFNFDTSPSSSNRNLPFETVCTEKNVYQYEKLFQNAVNECSLNLPGSPMICNGILCQIIGMLYNDRFFGNISHKTANKIEAVLDYLKDNFSRPDLKISELAEKASMSEKNFRRVFYDIYKKRPHEFLRDFRLNKAELLILNTSKRISDIAILCGFSDVYSFSHCFKQNNKISPKAFRDSQVMNVKQRAKKRII